MRDVVIAALAVAVGILGYFVHSTKTDLADQQRQLRNLSAERETIGLEQQEKCANQAQTAFTHSGWADPKALYNIVNHYNEKLNKCIVTVYSSEVTTTPPSATGPPGELPPSPSRPHPQIPTYKRSDLIPATPQGREMTVSISMSDAFEGKDLGYYMSGAPTVEPFQCYVRLPSGDERRCHSMSEFEELSKVYMQ